MHKDIQYLSSLIRRCSNQQIFISSLAVTLVIAGIQHVIGYELALSSAFLLPIALSTWYLGRNQGWLIGALASTLCFAQAITLGSPQQNSHAFWNLCNQIALFLTCGYVIHQLHLHRQIQQELIRIDNLTGLLNLRSFNETSQQLLTLASRTGNKTVLACVDLENFKHMNERFGHSVGEKALQEVSQHFRSCMRKTDVIGRISDDSFVILLPETQPSGARSKLGKLRNELIIKAHDHKWPIDINIGAVSFDTPPANINEAQEMVEQLMARIRRNDKNKFIFEHYSIQPA